MMTHSRLESFKRRANLPIEPATLTLYVYLEFIIFICAEN